MPELPARACGLTRWARRATSSTPCTPRAAALAWLANAWALFARARLPWLFLLATYYVVMMAVDLVPLIGQLAVPVIKPVFAVGFLAAAWTQERGGTPRVADLFMGFRSNLRALLVLGAVFVAGITVAVLSTTLVDGGKLIEVLTAPAPATVHRARGVGARRSTRRCATRARSSRCCSRSSSRCRRWPRCGSRRGWSCSRTCRRTSALAHRCAPRSRTGGRWRVYALRGVRARRRCCRASRSRSLTLVLPASIAAVLGVALLMPYVFFFAATLHISDYVSYRDVFHAGETLAPLTPGSAASRRDVRRSRTLSGGLELRVLEREPLQARLAEVDLHARIVAAAFRVDDDADAELRVAHVLADAPRRRAARRRLRRGRGSCPIRPRRRRSTP